MGTVAQQSRMAVLLFTDIEGSVALKQKVGDRLYAQALAQHDALFREIVGGIDGAEVVSDTGDGFMATFRTVSDAIDAGLRFEYVLVKRGHRNCPLHSRVGIHHGQVDECEEAFAGNAKLVGLAADIASRLTKLGRGAQILLTRAAFDEGRQYVRQHPLVEGVEQALALKWVAHGQYRVEGLDEPLEIFEVGAEGIAPLSAPPDGPEGKRLIAHDEESTLGWRPAIYADIPGRPGWALERRLGEGGFGEVWLGAQRQLGEHRVFKFCFDVARVRSLKREMTLFRLIREKLGDRADIARIHEVKLNEPPFFLESEYTEGGNLLEWAKRQGGIALVPLEVRLELVAAIAFAVHAAHSVGILHKDIKPSNILIDIRDGVPRPRLADFGLGMLSNPASLSGAKITISGFTQITADGSSRAGTPLYAPPEMLEGRPFTAQGDVYSLGVLLYQMVIGNLDRPLAQGWERGVADPLLRLDIASCVDGEVERRLNSALELTLRLRQLPQRREFNKALARKAEGGEDSFPNVTQPPIEQEIPPPEKRRPRSPFLPRLRRLTLPVVTLIVLLGTACGIFFYKQRRPDPDPNFRREEWVTLCDAYQNWFRVFAEPSEQANLQAEYGELVAKAKQNKVLNPREMVSGNLSLEEARGTPPTTRDGIDAAKDAIVTATVIQGELMRKLGAAAPEVLTATAVPDALLKRLDSIAQKYSDRGLREPADEVRTQADGLRNLKGADLIVQLREVLKRLALLNQIEQNWAAIEQQVRPVVDKDDLILKQVPDLVRNAVYVEGSRDPLAELNEKLVELKAEFATDADWARFFKFVQEDWKPDISTNTVAVGSFRDASPVYAMFRGNVPPRLTKFHLMEWMKDAGNYGWLKDFPNPAKDAELLAQVSRLGPRVTQLLEDYKRVDVDPAPVSRLDQTSQNLYKQLAELRQRPWRKGTREEIERGVGDIRIRLADLEKGLANAQADIRNVSIATADQLLDRIEERRFPPPLNGVWDKLKEKWRVKDPALKKELESQKARYELFRLSEAAAKQLRAIENSLPVATDFGSLVRNRKWGDALAKELGSLEAAQRYKAMVDAMRLVDFDRVATGNSVAPAANPEVTKPYQDWCERAKSLVALANELEDRLDSGYGFVGTSTGEATESEILLKALQANALVTKQVGVAVALDPLLSRCDQIQSLRGQPPPKLAEIAEKEVDDAARAIDLWRLLGDLEDWPLRPQDLETERTLYMRLPELIKLRSSSVSRKELTDQRLEQLKNEIEQQRTLRWRKFIIADRPKNEETQQALAKALEPAVLKEFGIADPMKLEPKLPVAARFNISLYERKKAIEDSQAIGDNAAKDLIRGILSDPLVAEAADPKAVRFKEMLEQLLTDRESDQPYRRQVMERLKVLLAVQDYLSTAGRMAVPPN